MCGACATAVSDWATPLVSGPRRRAALGRFVTSVCRGMVVRPVGSGWTAATMTGATRVARTLDALLDHVAGRLTCDSWSELEAALAPHEHRDGDAGVPPYDDYLPPVAADPGLSATTVLTVPRHGGLHLRLAAFGLGIRSFDRRPVALEAVHRRAPLRLLAAHGEILGAAPAGPAPRQV
jgi:hypothetical protein